jgi:hypothetical protein
MEPTATTRLPYFPRIREYTTEVRGEKSADTNLPTQSVSQEFVSREDVMNEALQTHNIHETPNFFSLIMLHDPKRGRDQIEAQGIVGTNICNIVYAVCCFFIIKTTPCVKAGHTNLYGR